MTAPANLRVILIPMKLPSLGNARLHWAKKMREVRRQRTIVAAYLTGNKLPPLPVTVTITRFGPRKLDSDNLAFSAKGVRDEIAHAYGEDDGSDEYDWQYRQQTSKEYGVEIRIETK